MSAFLARTAFAAAVRRSPATAARVTRRSMASSAGHGPAKSSDLPWIVGSLAVFGPAFLYLVSPTSRKPHSPTARDVKLGHPGPLTHAAEVKEVEEKPDLMADDEGTLADVSSSVALSQAVDVPNDSQSPAAVDKLAESAVTDTISGESAAAEPSEEAAPVDHEASSHKEGSFQKESETGPTNLKVAEQAAQEGVLPKQAAETKE